MVDITYTRLASSEEMWKELQSANSDLVILREDNTRLEQENETLKKRINDQWEHLNALSAKLAALKHVREAKDAVQMTCQSEYENVLDEAAAALLGSCAHDVKKLQGLNDLYTPPACDHGFVDCPSCARAEALDLEAQAQELVEDEEDRHG